MDRKERSQAMLLGVLLVILAGVVVVRVVPAVSTGSSSTSAVAPAQTPQAAAPATARRRAASGQPVDLTSTAVRLDTIGEEHPGPIPPVRNPFRFGQGRAAGPADPQRPVRIAEVPPPFVPAPVAPQGPPPPPPIPYKFIGLVTASAPTGKVAVLSDGKGVYHGREGEIVEGQYRIIRIGEESIQIEYADGRGRQTIRLTGS